jgi:LacI family transcriptional regulator
LSGTEKRRVKLIDIAAKTGFTVGTISKALQNKEGISRETMESILKAAKEIGYIANSQAGGLRSGSSKTIAIIVSDIANPLFSIKIKICVSELEKQGYRAIVMDTEESPEREEQAVISALNKNVDGVLLCPAQKSTSSIELLKKNGMPFVLMGRRFEDIDTDYVICDDEHGGYLTGKHLAELGHKRILVITADPEISCSRERLQGFRRAMEEDGIEIDPRLIIQSRASGHDAARIIDEVFAQELDFSAIFTFSDYIAWETIYALNSRGIRVPEDVSVAGFDDVQSHMCFPPPLTTVHYPKRTISMKAVELLLRRIRKDSEENAHIMLDTHLVVRQSTAPAKK